MTDDLMKQIEKLIVLERDNTFDTLTLEWWIIHIKSHMRALDPHWTCPCGEMNIYAGDSSCLEKEYVEEDYEDREEDTDDGVSDWADAIDYCCCNCRRSKVYGALKNELDLAYKEAERYGQPSYEEVNKAIIYFITQLKQLGK